MQSDRRRTARRLIDLSAKLFTGVDSPVWDCVVMDISERGARLAVESGDEIPDQFTLLLSAGRRVSHRCRVIWRAGRQMGVKFELLAAIADAAIEIPFAQPDFIARDAERIADGAPARPTGSSKL